MFFYSKWKLYPLIITICSGINFCFCQSDEIIKVPKLPQDNTNIILLDTLSNHDKGSLYMNPQLNAQVALDKIDLTINNSFTVFTQGEYIAGNGTYSDITRNSFWYTSLNLSYGWGIKQKDWRLQEGEFKYPFSTGIRLNFGFFPPFHNQGVGQFQSIGPVIRIQPFKGFQEISFETAYLLPLRDSISHIWSNNISIYQHFSSWITAYAWINGQFQYNQMKPMEAHLGYGILFLSPFVKDAIYISYGFSRLGRRVIGSSWQNLFWKYSYENILITGLNYKNKSGMLNVYINYLFYPSFCQFFLQGECNHISNGLEIIPNTWHSLSLGIRYLISTGKEKLH